MVKDFNISFCYPLDSQTTIRKDLSVDAPFRDIMDLQIISTAVHYVAERNHTTIIIAHIGDNAVTSGLLRLINLGLSGKPEIFGDLFPQDPYEMVICTAELCLKRMEYGLEFVVLARILEV